jgi:hypothetical protein
MRSSSHEILSSDVASMNRPRLALFNIAAPDMLT